MAPREASPVDREIDYLLARAIPDALDPIVRRAVGTVIARIDDGGRYRVAHTGRFSSRIAGDLLAFFRNQRLSGALLVIEPDVVRVLYFAEGRVVGASSDCLFERLGRVLARASVVEGPMAAQMVDREESQGAAAALAELPSDTALWAVETRVWDVAAALFFVHGGHFVIVEGTPELDPLPAVDLSPTDLSIEGLRRYDEWRNGTRRPAPARRPERSPPQAPVPARRASAADSAASAADELLARLQALD